MVSAGGNRTVTVEVGSWPANLTGERELRVSVTAGNESTPLDTETYPVTVITRDGGLDDDGLTNEREVALETDLRSNDTDGDGLEDGAEVNRYGTDPTDPDTDGDGVPDPREVDTAADRLSLAVAGLVGVAAVAVLVLLAWTGYAPLGRLRRALGTGRAESETDGSDRPDAPAASAVSGDGAGTGSDTGAAGSGGESAAAADEVPTELLSDEAVVFTLLDDHDGRMRQVDIVEETDWSKSKVRRVLSAMEEEDSIVKVDVGRGNVVMRPEDLPPGAESAFDD
jgi:hypothetical protein